MSHWRPSASPAAQRARADLYKRIRAFFAARGYLEVELPLLGRGGTTDPAIESFRTAWDGEDFYLQTSPEFFMKRLLAAGSGPIYSLGKVFRQGEQGRFHNPEFTMLEWYRPGFDDHQLMAEVGDLLQDLLGAPVAKSSYRDAFLHHLEIDPHQASLTQLKDIARQRLDITWDDDHRDVWLDLLFSHLIQPNLQEQITFIYDYPASQAALARVNEDSTGQSVARRFEAFYRGSELVNGYWELTDPEEQARRFAVDNQRRRASGQPEVRPDQKLIKALAGGLPDCAGVALGVDRLLMLITGARHLDEVLAFPWGRL